MITTIKLLKRLLLLFTVCLTVLTSYSCFQKEKQKPTITVAFNSWVGFSPLYIAKEKGYFKDEGLNVKFKLLEDTAEKHASFASGSIDILATTVDDVVILASKGIKGKIFLSVDMSNGADGIVAVKEIKTLKDLEGRQIAVQPGFVGHFFLLYLLKKNGIPINSVKILPTETGAAGAAFVAGKVDAAVTWEPWLSKAKKRKGAHVLVSSADEPGIIADVMIAREDFVKNHKDLLLKFRRAWFRALNDLMKDRENSLNIVCKAFKIRREDAVEMLKGVHFFTSKEDLEYRNEKLPEILKLGAQVWYESKIIDRLPKNLDEYILKNWP